MHRENTIMRKITTICMSIAVLLCIPLATRSAEMLDSSVTSQDGRYVIHMETVVQAPISKVHSLLMDYENFIRLNSVIKRVESVEHLDDGRIRMGVRSAFCILTICQYFDWVQDVQFLPDGDIAITIVPNGGDFRQGNGRWHLRPDDGGTRLFFDVDLTPKDRLLPVFGPWLVQRKFSEDAFEFARGLERMAISTCC